MAALTYYHIAILGANVQSKIQSLLVVCRRPKLAWALEIYCN